MKVHNIANTLLATLAVAVSSCTSALDFTPDSNTSERLKSVSLSATIAFDDNSSSVYDQQGKFTWGSTEKIAVFSENSFSEFTMQSGAGTNTATFTGSVAKSVISTYALYPYRTDYSQSVVEGQTIINYILPNTYDNYVPGGGANLPMYSEISDISTGNVKFYMLTGVLRYTMKNLPEGTASITFVTDKAISGETVVNRSNAEKPYVETPNGKQYVTYNLAKALTKLSDITIDVPLPAGKYRAFAVDIKDGEGKILKSVNFAKNLSLENAHIQKMGFDYSTSTDAYTIPNTGLPSVIIVTPNKTAITSKDVWTEGTIYAIHKADGSFDAFGTTSMKGRGNTTWYYPKKPYALKLDSKNKILGMAKHKRWCLLANWMDRTIMRNAVSFEIARKCPGLDWTPSGKFVEVIFNGEHIGNYYLCEQIKVDEKRVNIAELDNTVIEGEGITGGFIMELDIYYDEVNKFKSSTKNLPWIFKDPDDVNSAQLTYLQNYVNAMEEALYDDTKFAARAFTDFMDLASFVDWWFVHELSINGEPNHPKSSYMHKDKNGVIKAGPVWDFDWGTYTPEGTSSFTIKNAIYYGRLFEDDTFKALAKSKWEAQKSKFEEVYDFIDGLNTELAASDAINHSMWPISSNANGDESMTFNEAVTRLKNAYQAKLEWIDAQISAW